MKKIVALALVCLVVIAVGYTVQAHLFGLLKPAEVTDIRNGTYIIGSSTVEFNNGRSEVGLSWGGGKKVITHYFGEEIPADFNNDGRDDVAFLVTQQPGNDSALFYVVAALNTSHGYVGSHATLIGDRISPQSDKLVATSTIVLNYATRAQGEDFSIPPSVGKSVYLKFDTGADRFIEVAAPVQEVIATTSLQVSATSSASTTTTNVVH